MNTSIRNSVSSGKTRWRATAPLLIFTAGVGTLLEMHSVLTGFIALAAYGCYLLDMNKREVPSWILLTSSLVIVAVDADIVKFMTIASTGAMYGALMIAISFVQIPAQRSIVAENIASRIRHRDIFMRKAPLAAHAAGATLNLSGLIILQAATQRSGLDPHSRLLMNNLFLRGFATAPVWSPYSYFTPLVLTAFPWLNWPGLLTIGVLIAAVFMLVSYLNPPVLNNIPVGNLPFADIEEEYSGQKRHFWRWMTFILFFGCMIYMMTFTSMSSLSLIILVLPPLAIAWGFLEAGALSKSHEFKTSAVTHVKQKIPMLQTEILALAAAGMASQAVASWQPGLQILQSVTNLSWIGELLQSILFFAVLVATTSFGINPVLFIIPVATLLSDFSTAPFSPMVGLVILCCTWALFPTISPFAAATLITSRTEGITPHYLVKYVNRQYNVYAFLSSLVLIAVTVMTIRTSFII